MELQKPPARVVATSDNVIFVDPVRVRSRQCPRCKIVVTQLQVEQLITPYCPGCGNAKLSEFTPWWIE